MYETGYSDQGSSQQAVAMTCCQIRQGQDGQADEDIEDLAGQPKPQRQNEFGCKLDWLGKQQGEAVGE